MKSCDTFHPSWDEELRYFSQCIIDDDEIKMGSSDDALNTMKLVYKIYYADEDWRINYSIPNPNG